MCHHEPLSILAHFSSNLSLAEVYIHCWYQNYVFLSYQSCFSPLRIHHFVDIFCHWMLEHHWQHLHRIVCPAGSGIEHFYQIIPENLNEFLLPPDLVPTCFRNIIPLHARHRCGSFPLSFLHALSLLHLWSFSLYSWCEHRGIFQRITSTPVYLATVIPPSQGHNILVFGFTNVLILLILLSNLPFFLHPWDSGRSS